jgi:suppressor of G2 allele of SKP1
MSVEIAVKLPTGNNAQWSFCPLFAAVDPASVAIKYNNRNVEITVRKVMQGFHWAGLERKGVIAAVKPTSAAAAAAAGISTTELPATVADALPQAASALSYPNSKGRDWSRFKPEEEDENEGIAPPDSKKHSGDEGLQKLFRKIYADADDDTKRAMMKSYQESGGTVLSTNWKEIGAKRTERKAPHGMVMKRWGKDSDEEDSAKGSSSSSSDSSSDDE